MTALLNHALAYLDRGFSVIPIQGKKPTVRWKQYQCWRPTESDLRRLFVDDDPTGLAVICGVISGGLVVRDFDDEDSYLVWKLSHQELSEVLPTVKTARGYHVYFSNCHRRITKFDDGELRGAGYILVPPSIHPTSITYEWINPLPDGPLPEINPFAVGLGKRYRASRANRADRAVREDPTLTCACSVSLEGAISKTLPRFPGERNRRLLSFCRALKSIPSVAEADAMTLKPHVSEWYRRGKSFMSGEHDEDENFAEFCYAWANVRFSVGNGPFATALERLETTPLPVIAEQFSSPSTKRLIHLCRELQRVSGDASFHLSCRIAGEVIALEHMAAWRRLRLLADCGIIEMVQPGTKTRAARYRYLSSDSASLDGGSSK